MIMLPSVEARWFMAGSLPDKVSQWFKKGMVATAGVKPRTDHYLVLPGVASIGVKLREGKFEVKRRDVDFGLTHLGSRATGRLALWRKWGFAVAEKSGEEFPDRFWVGVEKTRLLRKYIVESGVLKEVDPDPAKRIAGFGCTLELTTLKVWGVEWWTLGFEAFGPDEAGLRDILECTATACLDPDAPALNAVDSFDYPEWLTGASAVRQAPPD